MTLREYLQSRSIRQKAFADEIDATQGYVSKLVRGEVVPSMEIAAKIHRVTDGAVPYEAWISKSGGQAMPSATFCSEAAE